jgi:hypothetical protein
MRTTKLLQHLVVAGNAFVGHCVRARAKGNRSQSQSKKLSPGQSRGRVEEAKRRGKDGGDWLRIGRDLGRRTWRQGIPGQEKRGREGRKVERFRFRRRVGG